MYLKRFFFSIIILSTISNSCSETNDDFIGLWQSLNDANAVLEITDNRIELFKDGESLWSKGTENGELSYLAKKIRPHWYNLTAYDGNEIYFTAKIEVVDEDRIRVYYFKHHNILDTADEYHRTKDFKSFREIMDNIVAF